jgi:hypothetical protein
MRVPPRPDRSCCQTALGYTLLDGWWICRTHLASGWEPPTEAAVATPAQGRLHPPLHPCTVCGGAGWHPPCRPAPAGD